MATYEIRHPELDDVSDYDKDKLIEAIEQYNKWHDEHHDDSDRKRGKQSGDALWANAIYDLKRDINEYMVETLTTLEDTRHDPRQILRSFQVTEIFSSIDNIRNELQNETVHQTLSNMQPELLMGILNKLEMCIRHVIQNTSIRRLRHNAVSAQKIGALEASMQEHTKTLELVMQRLENLETGGSKEEPKTAVNSGWGWRSRSNDVGVSQLLGRLEIMQNGDCGDQFCK